MKKYYDFEREIFLSESDLEAQYNELKATGDTEAETFAEYRNNCMYHNDGTLVRTDSAEYARMKEEHEDF